MATVSRLALGVALGLAPSCAVDPTTDPADLADLGEAEDAEVDDAPTESVCTTGTYRCLAHVRAGRAGFRASPLAPPPGLGPPELQSAYRIDPSYTVTSSPTVAIVVAFGYLSLESDLAVYRQQFGLPPCTIASGCLRIVNQRGQATPLPAEPPPEDDWRLEAALDMDMVSAACPLCKILVVQAENNIGDGLFIGQDAAVQLGATVVTNSWGGPETPGTTPAQLALVEQFFAHPNVAIFAAAGDTGFNNRGEGPSYPATSAHVISVGGTRLTRDGSARGWAETAWVNGGSACSLSVAKPAYQTVSPCPFKATADIAAVGDPGTGVAVYMAAKGGWVVVGGTSAASPFVAGIFAATGNGSQRSGGFLAANAGKLHDVTLGTNGTCGTSTLLCNAAAGWDGPTGYGTPNATALAPPRPIVPGPDPQDPGDVSGGCSTGRGAGTGLLLIALLGVLRRRRR